ncbi:unnamed protein product [Owenia fusiformis]|uniref:Uncharacterized protein n=1 Tax=Owenia fusiformis TaxID=6347 RepID=A0A8J1Y2D5_OWEFU|nr:unnamed protein product [Owenia fusiformis]
MKLYYSRSHPHKVAKLVLWFRRFGSRKMLRVVRLLAVKGTKMVTALIVVMLMLVSHLLLLTMYTNLYYRQIGQKTMDDYIAQNKIHVQNPRFLMYNTQSKSGSDADTINTNGEVDSEKYVKYSHRWRRKSEIENEQSKNDQPININTQQGTSTNSDGVAHGQPGRSFNRSLIVYLENEQKPKIPQYNKNKLLDLKHNSNNKTKQVQPIKNTKEKPQTGVKINKTKSHPNANNNKASIKKDQKVKKLEQDSAKNKQFPNPVALNAKPKPKPTGKTKTNKTVIAKPKPTKGAKKKGVQSTTPSGHSKNGSTTAKPSIGKNAVLKFEEINVIHKSDIEWEPTDDWKEEHLLKVPVKKNKKDK